MSAITAATAPAASAVDDPPPRGGIITVGTRRYNVGLFWQTRREQGKLRSEALTAAKSDPCRPDLYCLRFGDVRQFALGSLRDGNKSGLPAAAARVADALHGSSVCVFEVPEGYWFIQINSDWIKANGDTLYPTAELARKRLSRELSTAPQGTRVVVPKSWAIPNAEAHDLASLVVGRGSLLQRVHSHRRLMTIIVGVAAVVFGLAFVYSEWRDAERSKELARLEQDKRSRRDAEERRAREQVAPWRNRPLVPAFLQTCEQSIGDVPVAVPGWDLRQVECDRDRVYATYGRNGGSFGWLVDVGTPMGFQASAGDTLGNDGHLSRAIAAVATADAAPSLNNVEIKNRLWAFAHPLGLTANVRDVTANAGLPGDTKGGVLYRFIEFAGEGYLSPMGWAQVLSFSGAVVNKVTYIDGTWRVEGQFYVSD